MDNYSKNPTYETSEIVDTPEVEMDSEIKTKRYYVPVRYSRIPKSGADTSTMVKPEDLV